MTSMGKKETKMNVVFMNKKENPSFLCPPVTKQANI